LKYFFLILLFSSQVLLSQDNANPTIQFLEQYSQQFDIQFAYNPQALDGVELEKVNNVDELRNVFLEANVSVQEISEFRWLLKNRHDAIKISPSYLSGQVLDVDGEPLISALIYSGSGISSVLTDEKGKFTIEIREDLKVICCQYLGYKSQCISIDQALHFELVPMEFLIDDVQITTKKVFCSMSPVKDAEQLNIQNSALNEATLGKDVIRTFQLLSGVDATNDLSASLNIRATTGLQSLVTLDGIPLYNTESAFGMFSVLNPLVITDANLYKNSMPLEVGEFTGGYLQCEGLSQIQDSIKLNIDLNTLQTLASIQVPLNKNTQISGAFRRSNGRISDAQYYSKLRVRKNNSVQQSNSFSRPDQLNTSLDNQFGDLYFNVSHHWKGGNHFQVSVIGNADESGTNYEGTYPWNPRDSVLVRVEERYEQDKRKSNVGLSMRYLKTFESKANFLISYSSSRYNLEDQILSSITISRRKNQRLSEFNSEIRNQIIDNNLKFQYISDRSKKWSWKSGLDLRILNTNFGFRSNNNSPNRQVLTVPIVTPYLGVRYDYRKLLVMDFGVRNAIIPVSDSRISFASPRGKILVKLSEGLFIKSSASYSQQFFRPIELERQLGQSTTANVLSNNDIPVMKSAQLTLGLNYFSEGWKVNGDLYIRENTGIVEQLLAMPGLSSEINIFDNNDYELLRGNNRVAGLDISSGYENNQFSGLVSYTFSRSEDRFEDLFNYQPIPDQNNREHQVNLFSAYKMGDWTLSATYVYGSGLYTLNRVAIAEDLERNQVQPNTLFKQLPAYRRFDINGSYEWQLKKGSLYFDLGIYNLMNIDNVNAELYIYSLNQDGKTALGASQISLLGRIWTVGVRYQM